MSNPHRTYEIRCPVHGFIQFDEWEKEIISHPVFRRLSRIRQLSWASYVYPGATHTRFEHSLGVMHVATLLYDSIVHRCKEVLKFKLSYKESGLERHKRLVRLAALLHDIGHAPFSHAAEELMPSKGEKKLTHENYSAAIVRTCLKETIENHTINKQNYGITADEVASFLEGKPTSKYIWRELIVGQIDADRMDYLLRDSHYTGVQNGRFDLQRLMCTIVVIPDDHKNPRGGPRLGVTEGGLHAAESLILARYFMFTQVYFHKTTVAYNLHLQKALAKMLPGGKFPNPDDDSGLNNYIDWDDWKVLGELARGNGGEHGQYIIDRNHFRKIYHTPESPTEKDLEELEKIREALGELIVDEAKAEKSWYVSAGTDIPVVSEDRGNNVKYLSDYSNFIANMESNPNNQTLLYVKKESQNTARKIIMEIENK